MERQLQRLSWLTVQQMVPKTIDTVILPVGTVEAHGSSCLGTDNFIPETIAQGIADRLNALVAPTLNYGITRSLYRYNGGSTISPALYEKFVGEILDSLANNGFHHIIVMNGHGGNNAALKSAAMDFHQRKSRNIAVIHWWELCDKMTEDFFGHPGGHAGTDETAIIQALDPALAGQAQYDPKLAWYFRPGADIYPVPGSILLYTEGQGHPNYNLEQAKAYREKVIATVGDFAATVIDRWRMFGL